MNTFDLETKDRIEAIAKNDALKTSAGNFMKASLQPQYSYNFRWLGRPIIQYPQDIIAMQELIWRIKPDLIVETGIAHGGSVVFHASMMALLEKCGDIKKGHVVAVDIDIRAHNKAEIENHPLASYITMIQGSSVDNDVIEKVKSIARGYSRILVSLDSNHTHAHVLGELEAYAPLVTPESYCVVFDTIIEDMPEDLFPDRPWGRGNNPKTAVWQYLNSHPEFEIDRCIQDKLLITVAPDGYLKRIA
nr:cephalosporin hydroxylase [Desulfobacula sp.]